MQYSQGHPSGGGDTPIWCPFLGCHVKKYHRTCQGIKACEYLNEDLRNKVKFFFFFLTVRQSVNSLLDVQTPDSISK